METSKHHWKHFYDAIDERDQEFCKSLRDEISDLLLIVGIFDSHLVKIQVSHCIFRRLCFWVWSLRSPLKR